MTLQFVTEGHSPLAPSVLQKLAKCLTERLQQKQAIKIGLSFVDSDKIKQLNKDYAGNDYTTDVLSFSYSDNPESIGDIAICTEIAAKQAKEHSVSLESELVLLVLHGSLHLLGYDHQNPSETASMDDLQGDIMGLLDFNYRDFKWFH
jgi:probable rRNA maturation factor